MMNYEKLIAAGVDKDALLKRLMGNASLVGMFIRKFTEDLNFEKLKTAFAAQDMQTAEMASHTLKGMCGNLSLVELYQQFTEQVNLIRSENLTKAEAMMPELTIQYEKTIALMNEWLSEN